MKEILKYFFVLFTISHTFSFAQKEANFWYFGVNAGLDFTSGSPVVLQNGALNDIEGCATISDNAGNLLFYTDGIKAWNKNHVVMANGSGLMSGTSTTQTYSSASQSSIIIPRPQSSTIYYLFTVAEDTGPNGLRYSVVDMSLDGGLGAIAASPKNIPVITPVTEKITAVRHANGCDIWVIVHKWNSKSFYAYLVTSAGINVSAPVISSVGTTHNGSTTGSWGYMKISPDGSKLVVTSYGMQLVELFDFDVSTGAISHPVVLSSTQASISAPYGAEFSPDNTKLYITGVISQIYQFDLKAGSDAAVIASKTTVSPSGEIHGALQLGPDAKIYSAKDNGTELGIINNPNALGSACNYSTHGISLVGKTCTLGLPNFMQGFFYSSKATVIGNDTSLCLGQSLTVDAGTSPFSYLWSPGGETTSAITVSTPGTYVLTTGCSQKDSIQVSFNDCSSSSIYISNSFTPNGDGLNDVFVPVGDGITADNFSMFIFDRWGNKLYQTTNIDNGWDGKIKGEIAQEDIYTYIVNASDVKGEKRKYIGFFSLMK